MRQQLFIKAIRLRVCCLIKLTRLEKRSFQSRYLRQSDSSLFQYLNKLYKYVKIHKKEQKCNQQESIIQIGLFSQYYYGHYILLQLLYVQEEF